MDISRLRYDGAERKAQLIDARDNTHMWAETFATPSSVEEREGRRFNALEMRKKSEDQCSTPYEQRTPGIDMVSEILGRNASPSFPSTSTEC